MQPLHGVLAAWHDFFVLLGTAAGTLVGLLFVAATVSSGIFTLDRRAPLRVFLSATVVHFSSVLALSLIMLLPVASWPLLGLMVLACGLVGLGYSGLALRDSVRDGLITNIDWEDRTWYGVLPIVAYVAEAAAGITLVCGAAAGCVVLAACMGMLLVVGIHNAWDITVWTIMRRQGERRSEEETMSGQATQSDYWNHPIADVWADRHQQIDRLFADITSVVLGRADPRPGERVLDIGCGAGTTTLELAARVGPSGHVTGADISRHSTARARERIGAGGIGNAEIILADVGSHPFTQDSFDLAFSRFGVMFFPDPVASLSNVRAAMRQGGRLTFAVFRPRPENAFAALPYDAVAHLLPALSPPGPEEPGQFSWADPARVRRILGGAGFRDVTLTAFDPHLRLAGPGGASDAAEFALHLGPVSRALSTMDAPPTDALRSALEAFFRRHDTPQGIALAAALWIVQARV
jgi:SAM-dependent methyltransferase